MTTARRAPGGCDAEVRELWKLLDGFDGFDGLDALDRATQRFRS